MSAQTPTTPEAPLTRLSPFFEAVRLLTSFLQWRFSELPVGSYRFDPASGGPEQKNTEIFIGADTPINTETIGRRPAITVLRSPVQASGLSLNDMAFVNLATGGKTRMDLYPTNLMINVLSTEPVEAENLAFFCMEQVSAFREDICKESKGLIMLIGPRPMISAPSPAGSLVDSTSVEWCVVTVSFPAYLQHATTNLPLNRPILSGFRITGATAGPSTPVAPVALLQGTSIMQPVQVDADRAAATSAIGDLPQTGVGEAHYSEPLTIEIKT